MAVGATNVKDFAIIAGLGVAAGAVGMLAMQAVKGVQLQAPPLPAPNIAQAKAATYFAGKSYFWDFRDPGVHAHQNVIYNKMPWIELSNTTEWDANRLNFIGSYSSCSECFERRSPLVPERITNLR
jgi:hypothetical protein